VVVDTREGIKTKVSQKNLRDEARIHSVKAKADRQSMQDSEKTGLEQRFTNCNELRDKYFSFLDLV
jgi:hypothetical protein